MVRPRSGPVLAVAVLLVVVASVWFLAPWGSEKEEDRTVRIASDDADVEEEPDRPMGRPIPPLGFEPDPVTADVRGISRLVIDVVLPEPDVVPDDTLPSLHVAAEPVSPTILLVEKAMRDVLAALCRRAEECCPDPGICDLLVMEKMPMDEVAEEMVKQGGEGARLDDQALDDCLVALRNYPCDADFDGAARARCREGDDGAVTCDEIPGKPSIPLPCRRLVRGRAADGEACDEDPVCGGDAVCVKIRGAEDRGACRIPADRGEPCSWSADCRGDMLCVHGVCGPPRSAGQACEGEQPWCSRGRCRVGTCALGLICRDGLCAPQGRDGGDCRMEEDCVRGMVCDLRTGCRRPEEEEEVSHPGPDPDADLPICETFRRMNEQRR